MIDLFNHQSIISTTAIDIFDHQSINSTIAIDVWITKAISGLTYKRGKKGHPFALFACLKKTAIRSSVLCSEEGLFWLFFSVIGKTGHDLKGTKSAGAHAH